MPGLKIRNEYQKAIDPRVYEAMPKAVLAAIAVSFVSAGGSNLDEATAALVNEWALLHVQGIVPQAVPAKWQPEWLHTRASI